METSEVDVHSQGYSYCKAINIGRESHLVDWQICEQTTKLNSTPSHSITNTQAIMVMLQ